MAACRRVLDRVLEKDAHHLAHRGRVRVDDARLIDRDLHSVLLGNELHLADGVVDELVEVDEILVQDLALLVGARKEQQLLDEVLHILSLRADRGDALLEDLRIGSAPAREQVGVAENDRHRCPELMRGIRDEALLLIEAALQAVEHVVERQGEL